MLEEVAHELTMTLQQSSIGLEKCSFIDDLSKYIQYSMAMSHYIMFHGYVILNYQIVLCKYM